jgi:hypothetical protein
MSLSHAPVLKIKEIKLCKYVFNCVHQLSGAWPRPGQSPGSIGALEWPQTQMPSVLPHLSTPRYATATSGICITLCVCILFGRIYENENCHWDACVKTVFVGYRMYRHPPSLSLSLLVGGGGSERLRPIEIYMHDNTIMFFLLHNSRLLFYEL